MCSIIASFSKDKIKDLVKINQYRGNFSYSISAININTMLVEKTIKDFGLFNYSSLDNIKEGFYYICHVQAPTNGILNLKERIHPTELKNSRLWHNGIITPKGVKYLQNSTNINSTFDTELLHTSLYYNQFKQLSEIEGLFSCVYLNQILTLFRTKHGKLYIDEDLNISSERFQNSKCINYNTIYKVDFKEKNIIIYDTFKTKRCNFIIQGEL